MIITEFADGTKNAAIFETTAPYQNPYQGDSQRWLFVCSAGLLRSPTGATMAAKYGINARSCGSSFKYALVPCSANLINWAHRIIFVNPRNKDQLESNYQGYSDLLAQINEKAVVLDIPDVFEYMDPKLQQVFKDNLFEPHNSSSA